MNYFPRRKDTQTLLLLFLGCFFLLLLRRSDTIRVSDFFHACSRRRDGPPGGKSDQEVSVHRLRRQPTADREEAASRRLGKRRFVLQHRRLAPHRPRQLCLLPRPSRRHLQVSVRLFRSRLGGCFTRTLTPVVVSPQMERRERCNVGGRGRPHHGSLRFRSKRLRSQSRR